MKILVAEDDITSRKLLVRTLNRLGHEVIAAVDGNEAWEIFQTTTFQLVISDWIMPGMNGLQLCHLIRGADHVSYTFVILLTVKDDKESLLEAFDAGVDDFLGKPFDKAELLARIRTAQRVSELESLLAQRYVQLQDVHKRVKKDLAAAAKIQQSLLPSRSLKAEKNKPRFAWHLESCDELAGDIFNVVHLNKHETVVYLLDVSGHGVASALMSVTLSRLLSPTPGQSVLYSDEATGNKAAEPSEVLARLNSRFQISEETGSQYFTIIYGVLNHQSNEFKYCLAGHPPLLLLRDGKAHEVIQENCMPIGFSEINEFTVNILKLQSDDRLLLYSDGLVELPNLANELYGIENVQKVFEEMKDNSLKDTVSSMLQNVLGWNEVSSSVPDDVSLLMFEIL